ncbi:MAG: hypothetical protein HYV63_12280 [Candidatus Schekmanbacteria bacterium]|nr:hypothetical protein [Candidatus Schekmanbacteria bacterium]
MSLRILNASLLLAWCFGCLDSGRFPQPTLSQQLPSGRSVKVTSCQLVWGVEHGERHANQDAFALEYVTAVSAAASKELDQEALEVFELIRPVSEQWGFSTAYVSAFASAERSGKYEIFAFSRSADGRWSCKRSSAKVFNTDSGHKPGRS